MLSKAFIRHYIFWRHFFVFALLRALNMDNSVAIFLLKRYFLEKFASGVLVIITIAKYIVDTAYLLQNKLFIMIKGCFKEIEKCLSSSFNCTRKEIFRVLKRKKNSKQRFVIQFLWIPHKICIFSQFVLMS